jgi:hypothetical protein
MIPARFAAIAAVAILGLSAPAFAQMSTPGNAMGPATNGTAGAMNTDMPKTCQGMMDKAGPKMDSMSDGSKKTMAMKQMDMAKTAMTSGDENTCMSHMKMAMHDMM